MGRKHLFEKPKDETVAESVAVEEVAADEEKPVAVLPEGHVWIDVLDGNGGVLERISIHERDHGFRITLNGAHYEHVSDHADGVWQFEQK